MFLSRKPENLNYCLYLKCSKNNTIGTLIEKNKKIILNFSAGSLGYKNSKKRNSFVVQSLVLKVAETLQSKHTNTIFLKISGISTSRYLVIKEFLKVGIFVKVIFDHSKIAFNGCKPCKS